MIIIYPVFIKKKFLNVVILVIMLCCVQLSAATEVATIHGAVYEWDSFQPLENVIVEINSTPSQSMLARYGLYSFKLAPGDYLITASYYRNGILLAYTEEELTITDDGDYVVDLLLFPVHGVYPLDDDEFSDLDHIADILDNDDKPGGLQLRYQVFIFLLIFFIMVIWLYYLIGKRNKDQTPPNSASGTLYPSNFGSGTPESGASDPVYHSIDYHITNNEGVVIADENKPLLENTYEKMGLEGLPQDLREVLVIIKKSGGRITQKDLRAKLRHSEAKVSLMVSDLEDRGLVRKIKKGRGNVIILEENGSSNQNV